MPPHHSLLPSNSVVLFILTLAGCPLVVLEAYAARSSIGKESSFSSGSNMSGLTAVEEGGMKTWQWGCAKELELQEAKSAETGRRAIRLQRPIKRHRYSRPVSERNVRVDFAAQYLYLVFS